VAPTSASYAAPGARTTLPRVGRYRLVVGSSHAPDAAAGCGTQPTDFPRDWHASAQLPGSRAFEDVKGAHDYPDPMRRCRLGIVIGAGFVRERSTYQGVASLGQFDVMGLRGDLTLRC
jgi:hypothetical protein